MKVYLNLANGSQFIGTLANEEIDFKSIHGELVFNTSMCGYQEILTDPSYANQIITLTYPIIGSYGAKSSSNEAETIFAKALIVKELVETPSHFTSEYGLRQLCSAQNIPIITGLDTRAITKEIRSVGAMMSVISLDKDERPKNYEGGETAIVSTKEKYTVGSGTPIALIDYGVKKSIINSLIEQNFQVTVYPYTIDANTIQKTDAKAVVLSNGPGDPKDNQQALSTIKELQQHYPMLCICMGHQLFSIANGANSFKLKYGHRGANHPVLDLNADRVFMTSQNHGYAIDVNSLTGTSLEVTQINLNDKTIEAVRHKELPIISVQYHPEAGPGPQDTHFIFDEFAKMIQLGSTHA